MIRKSSGEAFAQLKAERKSPKADVWWGGTGDGHLQAAESKLTESYKSPRADELHPWARLDAPRYRTTGIYMGALGYAVNTEWVAKTGTTTPATWKELLSPRFKGEIQIANPNSSGTAYTALATFVQMYGMEEGFAFLKKLHNNVNQYTKSGAAPVRAAGRGETAVGIAFLHDAATQKAAGFPLTLVAPAEGTGYEVGCVSVVRGGRHPDEAREFVDWALSPQAQSLAARAKAFQVPSHPQATRGPGVPDLSSVKLIDFDFVRFSKASMRRQLLRRWDREVRTASR